MANIAGSERTGLIEVTRVDNTSPGFTVQDFSVRTHVVTDPSVWKNQGWYAAGSAYETWVSTAAPSVNPPSGHTLTEIQHQLLRN